MQANDMKLIVANSKYGGYASKFKKHKREKFKLGQNVLVAKREIGIIIKVSFPRGKL